MPWREYGICQFVKIVEGKPMIFAGIEVGLPKYELVHKIIITKRSREE